MREHTLTINKLPQLPILLAAIGILFAFPALAGNASHHATSGMAGALVSEIRITASDEVMAETKVYDHNDVAELQKILHKKVTGKLQAKDLLSDQGAVLELTITDLIPNRPTMAQYKTKPGLSFESYGVGGAAVNALLVDASGHELGALEFSWREVWIDQARSSTTWSDARRAFGKLARTLAEELAADPQS